ISMATGEIIAILNSDDRLEPTAIEEVTAAHRLTPSDIYYGQLIRFRQAGGKLLQKTLRPDLGKMYKTMSIFHPATCITKATYERLGFYNEQYRIAADYDFLLRAMRAGCSFRYIDKPLCRFLTTGGISAMSCRSYAEAVKIHRAHKTGYAGYMRWMHIKCMCKILAKTIIFTLLNALGLRPALDRQIARRWEKQVKL
ncbi:MAG: hypothetical protein ACE5DN_05555, partial [Flavobacteriales bacterium]